MNSESIVLVCVTAQQSSENLVKAGKEIAEKSSSALEVVSVLPLSRKNERSDHEIIERLYQLAKSYGSRSKVYPDYLSRRATTSRILELYLLHHQ